MAGDDPERVVEKRPWRRPEMGLASQPDLSGGETLS